VYIWEIVTGLGNIDKHVHMDFRRFLEFGLRNPSLFSCHARSRLNSFGTLDLKIVGKKVTRYRCVPKMASPEARK
jgi:hypothetical protein